MPGYDSVKMVWTWVQHFKKEREVLLCGKEPSLRAQKSAQDILFSNMAVFAFSQVLSLDLRARNHLLFDFCCILTSKSLSVLCKFTALHYRNTWLYSPIFLNAGNCQE